MDAINLSQIALDTVANDGFTHLARNGEPKLSPPIFPPDHKTNKFRPHPFSAFFKDRRVVPLSGEPLPPWKRVWSGHNRLDSSRLRGKPFPALCPATPNHRTPIGGSHARQKPMVPFTFQDRWLKGLLHRNLLCCALLTLQPKKRKRLRIARIGAMS